MPREFLTAVAVGALILRDLTGCLHVARPKCRACQRANPRVMARFGLLEQSSSCNRRLAVAFLVTNTGEDLDRTGIFCTRWNERKFGTKELEHGGKRHTAEQIVATFRQI